MLALSTAWFARARLSREELFALLVHQGFSAFELNYVVHPVDPDAFNRLKERYGFQVVSLHNICSSLTEPLEPDDHYGDNLASLNEAERRQSVAHLRSTAETALRIGARAVVIHAGSVPAAKADQEYRALLRAYGRGEVETEVVFREMRRRFVERKALGRPHLEQLRRSLWEVCPDYPALQFGLESRYHYYSLPDIVEMGYLLETLGLDNVGYWHDCGHAQVQENLGLCRHEDWLVRYASRLIGVHVHGMKDVVHDHAAPAPGNMPFEMIVRYLRDDTILVLELNESNPLDSVIAGREYVEKLWVEHQAKTLETIRVERG